VAPKIADLPAKMPHAVFHVTGIENDDAQAIRAFHVAMR
jgi:hypothetical protein